MLNILNLLKYTYQQILPCMFAAFNMFPFSWPVNLKMDRMDRGCFSQGFMKSTWFVQSNVY